MAPSAAGLAAATAPSRTTRARARTRPEGDLAAMRVIATSSKTMVGRKNAANDIIERSDSHETKGVNTMAGTTVSAAR